MSDEASSELPSTTAAPFARRLSTRQSLRRVRRALEAATCLSLIAAGIAWTQLVRLDWNVGLLIVPLAIAASGGAVYLRRRPWAPVVVRAALWGSFVCGSASVVGIGLHKGLPVAVCAAVGLLCLGRFSRSVAGARPLLVALVAIGVSDAVSNSLVTVFAMLDAAPLQLIAFFGLVAAANGVGLFCIFVYRQQLWPHLLGNVAVVAMCALADIGDMKSVIRIVVGSAALVQVLLAVILLATKPMSSRVRRAVEVALRIAIVVATLVVVAIDFG